MEESAYIPLTHSMPSLASVQYFWVWYRFFFLPGSLSGSLSALAPAYGGGKWVGRRNSVQSDLSMLCRPQHALGQIGPEKGVEGV